MRITARQRLLLANLERITLRKKVSGRLCYALANQDCTSTINSLLVRQVLVRAPNGRSLAFAGNIDPSKLGLFAV